MAQGGGGVLLSLHTGGNDANNAQDGKTHASQSHTEMDALGNGVPGKPCMCSRTVRAAVLPASSGPPTRVLEEHRHGSKILASTNTTSRALSERGRRGCQKAPSNPLL